MANAYKKDLPIYPIFEQFLTCQKTPQIHCIFLISTLWHIKYYCRDYDFPYLIKNVSNLDKNMFRFINAIPSD